MIRIITSLVAVLTVASIQSQTTLRDTPKLVIGITIDQLRGDYLELFQHSFSEKGFKRLLNEGLIYQNLSFDYPNLNAASSIATIYTGTTPFYHGITNSKKYVSDKNAEISIFSDDTFLGNYTKEKLSPKSLKSSTITDELKIASQNKSDIYTFAPNSFQALISAGHTANGAYWIEDYSGKWATTTYFKDFHWTVDQENRTNTYSNQINNTTWQPLLATNKYNIFPYGNSTTVFSHQFSTSSTPYIVSKESPFVNENITKTAIKLLQKNNMGRRSSPDFLALTYYAGNYSQSVDTDYSLEIQDTYVRLDREISSLLEYIEKTVGVQNTFIFITSTGYYNSANNPTSPYNQIFYSNRCEALLNMYLMAIYGKEQWVEKYYDQQIFLNRKLIENKNISLEEIQNKAAEFVIQFSGVQDAVTLTHLLSGNSNTNMNDYRKMINKELSGDIILEIQPGFQIVDEHETTIISPKKIQRDNAIVCPVIFWGLNLKPEKINRTIKATEIAPTISRILRIRSPNAAKDLPLSEFF
jgi:hypothetical protein